MAIPEFRREPSKEELREFSQARMAEKRKQLSDWIRELRALQKADPEDAKKYLPPEQLLKTFYEEVGEVYQDLPMDKGEIERNFSSEHLSEINLGEYVDLLKKVPPRFILHVTRQGVRDRVSFHSGRGEVSRGFEGILQSGELQSTLERYLGGILTKESVRGALTNYLQIPEQYPNREAAAARVREFLTSHGGTNLAASEIADISALHASMDFVADDTYGGEPGNEIFFLYPAAYVASQFQIAAQWDIPPGFNMQDSTMGSQYNDLWLKSKSNNAGTMPIDAAIVFIPEGARVDPSTGSRYLIDQDGKAVPNTAELNKIKAFILSPELRRIWPDAVTALNNYPDFSWEQSVIQREMGRSRFATDEARLQTKLVPLQAKLQEAKETIARFLQSARDFGIQDQRFFQTLLENPQAQEFRTLRNVLSLGENDQASGGDDSLDEHLAAAGLAFQLADPKTAIDSHEYWEQFFQRSGRRPSKVIYYEQATPNEALDIFRHRVGLADDQHKELDLRTIFEENIYRTNRGMHDAMQREREIFAQYSEEVLSEIYPEKEN